MDHQRGT